MKILLATDGSAEATAALRSASRLLKHDGLDAHVLCVAPGFVLAGSALRLSEEHHRRVIVETRRILERARGVLCSEGIDSRLLLRTGSPARVITDLAEEYDLTVIGAKGREAQSQGGLGPVASTIVSHVSGALFVGRALRADRGARILVALDGSAASVEALETLTSTFDLDSAEVTLMHVVESPWLRLGLQEESLGGTQESREDVEDKAVLQAELKYEGQQLIERARDQLLAQHPAVNTLVEQGNPANELLSEVDRGDYDLIVVGGTGKSDLKHQILGSVSARIAWNAPCSVLLVKSAP